MGEEWAAMNSPTILLQASATSDSCNRSLRPSRCITCGKISLGAVHRLCVTLFSGKPRHSLITLERRAGFIFCHVERSRDISRYFRAQQRPDNIERFLDFSRNDKRLVPPPHVAWQNIQLGAVLGHRPARNRNAALAQNFHDLLVAEG